MINEIELWEQEIAESARQEEALKEASIYNFYDGEVVQEGKILKNLGKVIKHIINKKSKNKKYVKSSKAECTDPMEYTAKKAGPADFDYLYKTEAMCAEGFADADKPETQKVVADYISKNWKDVDHSLTIKLLYCKGKDINSYYHLTDDNAYPDTLTFLFIDCAALCSKSSPTAGYQHKGNFRWFSDVVDNNARREIEKGNEHYKNYHSLYGDDWFWGTCNPPEDWNK
jgi:hypothetical protein